MSSDLMLVAQLHPFHYTQVQEGRTPAETRFFTEAKKKHVLAEAIARSSEEKLRAETSSAVSCKKCEKNSVSFVSVQLRRADEGMSMMYVCRDCGFNWTDK